MGIIYQALAFLVSFALFLPSAFGYVQSLEQLDKEYAGDTAWLQEVFPGYDKLSYEWLKSTIKDNDVNSIEELLPLLPEGLRKSYTLVKDSAALQGADEKNPRAILFAPDARLVLAFNGEEYQDRFQHLEILDYTAVNGAARLFDIDFSKRGEERFSAANSATCMKCHASYPKPTGEAKPIWPNYNRWFGSYGEDDDRLDSAELEDYSAFVERQSAHPRYKWLIRESHVTANAPYHRTSAKPTENEYTPGYSQAGFYKDNGLLINPRNPRF
ncbi:MAG: hypothetical protein AAF202_09215, partial [Pseudomonadota bacterium]